MRKFLIGTACILSAALIVSAAKAQPMCGDRAGIIRNLGEKYGETRRSVGLAQSGVVIELYASEATGTWTILGTDPAGVSCLLSAGEAFHAEEQQPGDGT